MNAKHLSFKKESKVTTLLAITRRTNAWALATSQQRQ